MLQPIAQDLAAWQQTFRILLAGDMINIELELALPLEGWHAEGCIAEHPCQACSARSSFRAGGSKAFSG